MNDVASLMAQATRAFDSGDFARARDIAQRAAKGRPDNPQVLQFLGIAQAQAGAPAEGFATLKRALTLAPGDRSLRLNAARAALDAGRFGEVEGLCAPIAGDPAAKQAIAQAARLAGDPQEAIRQLELLVAERDDDPQLLNNYGNALFEAGLGKQAVAVFEKALRLAPDEAQIWLNHGRALTSLLRFDEAVNAFEKASSLNPSEPSTNFELGKSLFRHGRYENALLRLSAAARAGLRDPQLFVLIGLSYASLEQREQAERSYEVALTVDPADSRATLALAIMYEQGNRLPELERLLTAARERAIEGTVLEYIAALVLRRRGDLRGALEKAQSAYSEHLDSVVRSQFVGLVADQLKDVDLAFSAFTAMNEGMAGQPGAFGYDGTELRQHVEGRTAYLTPAWYRGWKPHEAADRRPAPAFLGGFPRSGTTLLDTILMGHPQTEVREEEGMIPRLEDAGGRYEGLPLLSPERVDAMRAAYFTELRAGGPVPPDKLIVDKYPLMTLRAAYIHRAFPDARFIFALRHPCDVVLSCWMQNFRVTWAMASFLTLENAAKLYDAAMTHWERCRELMPLAVHTVRYEELVIDLEGEMRPLIDFLGLDWDDSLLDHQRTARERGYIRTPSYAQVTEKLYTRSSGRWEAYRKQMEPVLPILAPWVKTFGYEPL